MTFKTPKKTYFAILAHKNEEALAAQVQNIRYFNPNAEIIIYNGGANPDFGKGLNTLYYPNCHPIRYGNLTAYFWEIMKWLEQNNIEYEYLINLDHDVLFVKHGFQEYLDELMKGYDVMGWDMVASHSPSDAVITCCREMWKEWDKWKRLFRTKSFLRYLNSTQVYRHDIVRRMLETTDHRLVEDRIAKSGVFALEEIFFVTLASSKGAKIREYPREENWKKSSRFRSQISMEEAAWVRNHPLYYWIHPVKEERLIHVNNWLFNEIEAVQERQESNNVLPLPSIPNQAGKRHKKTEKIKQTKEVSANKKRKQMKQPNKAIPERKPQKTKTAVKKRTPSPQPSLKERQKTKGRTPAKPASRSRNPTKRTA